MPKYIQKTFFKQFGKNTSSFKPYCTSIIFKNSGDQVAKINDKWVLQPGDESPTISTGHPEVVDATEYQITFEPTTGTGPLINCIYTQTKLADNKNNKDDCEPF